MATTLQFITQVKLGELRRQRSLLLKEYDRLAAEAAAQPPVAALKTLVKGLQAVKVAGKPLHPDLGNLDLLYRGAGPSAEIVAFWRRRLDAELQAGRLRADIVYLFGALLGEWGQEPDAQQAFLTERQQAHQALLRQVLTPPADRTARAAPLFDELYAADAARHHEAAAKIEQAIIRSISAGNHAYVNLAVIAGNIYLPPAVRQEARRFLDDAVLQTQLVDALRVVTQDLRDWTWPADGVTSRALWTRNKWRLYVNLSLVQLCVLDSFGELWASAVEDAWTDTAQRIIRLSRLQKLLELNAPAVILDNERRMVRQQEERIDFGWYEPVDPWDGLPPITADLPAGGIVTRRADEQASLRRGGRGGYYGAYEGNRMVSLVHAEVRTLRAAFPDQPLFVAKLDVRDYFASIPHELLLAMVRRLGLPDVGVEAVQRFLAVPYRVDATIAPARCGVPMDQDLSHWLAEWLLRLLERYVHRRVRVRIVRQIDDICLLSPSGDDLRRGWAAVNDFLTACGLEVNTEKCGACAIGGELPEGLPAARPRWGLLEITETGEWNVHEPTFQTFCADARRQVEGKQAVLGRVTLYNAHLRFLTAAIGLALDLGDEHRRSVYEALRRFDADFFGPGVGVVAGLRDIIRQRYLAETGLGHLPDGWMYWPVTAGGLGLRSAFVLTGQYQKAYRERKKNRVAAPSGRSRDWQHGDAGWSAFYDDHLKSLEPTKPRETKVMKTLVDDFIARGQEISAGKQQGLSDYWRWVLCVYGPEVLDRFGTFRFLLTDLVPLQLIHEQLVRDSSLEG